MREVAYYNAIKRKLHCIKVFQIHYKEKRAFSTKKDKYMTRVPSGFKVSQVLVNGKFEGDLRILDFESVFVTVFVHIIFITDKILSEYQKHRSPFSCTPVCVKI